MRHPNEVHQESLTTQEKIGLWVVERVNTIWCAIIFSCIGITSLVGIFTGNAILGGVVGGFSSYFLQLVFLPLIGVGNNAQSKHQQIFADHQYQVNVDASLSIRRVEMKLNKILNLPPQHRDFIV